MDQHGFLNEREQRQVRTSLVAIQDVLDGAPKIMNAMEMRTRDHLERARDSLHALLDWQTSKTPAEK